MKIFLKDIVKFLRSGPNVVKECKLNVLCIDSFYIYSMAFCSHSGNFWIHLFPTWLRTKSWANRTCTCSDIAVWTFASLRRFHVRHDDAMTTIRLQMYNVSTGRGSIFRFGLKSKLRRRQEWSLLNPCTKRLDFSDRKCLSTRLEVVKKPLNTLE